MDSIKLTLDKLSVEDVSDIAADDSCGAISLFVGTTRNNFEGKQVVKLEYEAYQDMAESEIRKICASARLKFKVKNIAIHHRLGTVPVKEASVVIAVSSEHRHDSLEAVSFLIDSLKASVPIWKKELYDTGSGLKTEIQVKEEPLSDCEEVMGANSGNCTDSDEKEKKPEIVDPALIQITASKQEIERRIKAFQKRKREELDVLNVQDFCLRESLDDSDDSCARTTAVIHQSLGSKSHLKLTKVVNPWGPQTLGVDPGSLHKKEVTCKEPVKHDSVGSMKATSQHRILQNCGDKSSEPSLPVGIAERLHNIEDFLGPNPTQPVPSDIYARIKVIEDKVLYLESISPEYFSKGLSWEPRELAMKEVKATDDDMLLRRLSSVSGRVDGDPCPLPYSTHSLLPGQGSDALMTGQSMHCRAGKVSRAEG